jgi:hypothetical protein
MSRLFTISSRVHPYVLVLVVIAIFPTTNIAFHAQPQPQERKRGRTSRPRQDKVQPSPQPSPTSTPSPPPPQKSEVELLIEKDLVTLSTMTAEQKASVRAAIEALDRNVRIYELRGYDSTFLIGLEMDGVEKVVLKGISGLPESTLKNLLTNTWINLLDAWSADNYYRRRHGDDKFLALIDRYKLRGQPAYLIGTRILERASGRLALAKRIAEQIGVI